MWSIVLAEPIRLENGQVLRTLEDVRLFLIAIPSDLARHSKWQALFVLLIDAAALGEPELVDLVSENLMIAIETPPYAPVRLMPVRKPPNVQRRGVGRPRKKLLGY